MGDTHQEKVRKCRDNQEPIHSAQKACAEPAGQYAKESEMASLAPYLWTICGGSSGAISVTMHCDIFWSDSGGGPPSLHYHQATEKSPPPPVAGTTPLSKQGVVSANHNLGCALCAVRVLCEKSEKFFRIGRFVIVFVVYLFRKLP